MIKVEHLTKCYGNFMAVKDLSFEIDEGHVYGFLGPNGAGKSTTMNIMTGCLSATDGKVTISGYDIFEEPEAAKKMIGYLPEQPPLYLNETPLEYLRFVGEAKGLKGEELKQQIEDVVEQVGIGQVKNKLISALSKGYKQRVGVAQALLGNPRVIILDEPTVGLDPIQIIEIRELIKKLGETHTVILSSHILSEVQAICEQVLIISKGKLVAFDTPENLETLLMSSNEIICKVTASREAVNIALSGISHITDWSVEEIEEGGLEVHIKTDTAATREVCGEICKAMVKEKAELFELTSKKVNLEDVFIELTESGSDPDEDTETDMEEDAENAGPDADAYAYEEETAESEVEA